MINAPASLSDPRLVALIEESNAYAVTHSPPGKSYAIAPDAAAGAGLSYWLAMEGEAALGCIGLKPLASGDGEIKSLHVAEAARGRGVAEALMESVIDAARAAGLVELKFETGSSPGYAASRRFYLRMGFTHCPPFGEYLDDEISYCMTRRI